MAQINGSVSRNSSKFSYYVIVSELDRNVAENKTKIRVATYIKTTNTAYTFDTVSAFNHYIKVDGIKQSNLNLRIDCNPWPSNPYRMQYVDLWVDHNPNGTKIVAIETYSNVNAASYGPSACSASGNVTLTTIPREAKVTSVTDFTDTTNPKIEFTNTGGMKLKPYINFYDSATDTRLYSLTRSVGTYSSPYNWSITDAERNAIRDALGTRTGCYCYIGVDSYNSSNTYIGYSSKYARFVNVLSPPTFKASQVTYADTNSTVTDITLDNQKIVRNKSNLKVTVEAATGNKGASISKYEATLNGVTRNRTSAGVMDFGTVNSVSNLALVVKVTDSRGNATTVTKTVTMLDWVAPGALIDLHRLNNYEDTTYLTVDAQYSSIDSKNSITIKYKYKKSTDANYGSEVTLQDNVQATLTLDNNYMWDVQITVTDLFATTIYNMVVSKGIPIMFIDGALLSVGVNCLPILENSLEVNGVDLTSEIGEWTPEVACQDGNNPTLTYTRRYGNYRKLGRMVYVQYEIRGIITAIGSGNNYACIEGLPYTVGGDIFYMNPLTNGVNYNCCTDTVLQQYAETGTKRIRLQNPDGSSVAFWKVTPSGTYYYFELSGAGWYPIA